MTVRMLPSQEEPILDPVGLWYVVGQGVMTVEIVMWSKDC